MRVSAFALFAVLFACSKSAPPPAPAPAEGSAVAIDMHPAPKQPHVATRADLPPKIKKLVPQHGIYAAGGGLTSAPWRIVVDTDANTIYRGAGTKHNAPSFGPMETEATAPLADADKQRLMQLATDLKGEKAQPVLTPNADYDEILAVIDGDAAFFANGFGPMKAPIAVKLIADLRKTAGL